MKVRSTRPPQPAWLRAAVDGSVEVELRRRRGWRVARSGLRVLRCGRRARRVCSAAASSPARSPRVAAKRARSAPTSRRSAHMIARRGAAAGRDGGELDKDAVTKAYARWAPIYDFVFGAVFDRGRKASIAAAERIGGRILEVGVGTGISLPDYARTQPPDRRRSFGADAAEGARSAPPSIARAMSMGSRSWTRSTSASRTASSMSSSRNMSSPRFRIPEATLDEFARVLGRAARSSWSIILAPRLDCARAFERGLAPLARRLGWRPEFRWQRLRAMGRARMAASAWSSAAPMPPLGHFSLIRFARTSRFVRRSRPSRRAHGEMAWISAVRLAAGQPLLACGPLLESAAELP